MTRTTSTTRLAVLAAAAVLAVFGVAGCSSGNGSDSSSKPSAAPSHSATSSPSQGTSSSGSSGSNSSTATITIKDFKYSGPSRVKAGTKITVTNEDSTAHTVTADKGAAFDVQVAPGKTATFTAPKAGSYPFHCTYHSNMHGTLKVS